MTPLLSRNANLELHADSAFLELLPLKDSVCLHRGDRVVVAEFDVHPADSIDSLWVKLAHSEELQGWIRQSDLIDAFNSTDTVSQIIYFLTHSCFQWIVLLFSLVVGIFFLRMGQKRKLNFVFRNDIQSLYPLFLCWLAAVGGTIYRSLADFAPALWRHYTFNPTLSPADAPGAIAAFLLCMWLTLLVTVASVGETFRYLSAGSGLLYLLGLSAASLFCFLFSVWTTGNAYVGYLFLLGLTVYYLVRILRSIGYGYRCGSCGKNLKKKGRCPHCGMVNR